MTGLEEDDKREAPNDGPPGMPMHHREHLRPAADSLEGLLHAENELRIEARTLPPLPSDGLLKLDVRLRVEPDAHGVISGTS